MSVLLVMPGRDTDPLAQALADRLPGVAIEVWPEVADPDAVSFAVLWKHPGGCLRSFPNLRAATSYGAGVDFIAADAQLPPGLPVGRIVDPELGRQVAGYVLAHVLERVRELPALREAQARGEWRARSEPYRTEVGILGLGTVGAAIADAFARLGFPVKGWTRTGTGPGGVTVFSGRSGLLELAGGVDFLVCALPLTALTRGILDGEVFAAMRAEAVLINVGRGQHIDEDALLEALAAGRPAGAVLDVFSVEPLPAGHPFWTHPRIVVTPHVAGLTDPRRAAERIARSYRSVMAGAGVLDAVDLTLGY